MRALTRQLALALAALAVGACHIATAQTFPAAPVHIVVPYPPGGGADVFSRALANELAKAWDKPVVIDNVPGANTIIGAQRVARAAPDGLTLMITLSSTLIGNRFLYKSLPYDPDKAFVPVSMLARSGQVIVASSKSKLSSIADVMRERGVLFGSPGKGSQEELLMESVSRKERLGLVSIPYKGVAPTITALLSGEVQLGVASPGLVSEYVKSGQVRALAIAAPHRSSLLPVVPTTIEAGLPYAQSIVWYGLFAVAGTPDVIVRKISTDVLAVLKNPSFVERHVTARGLELVASSPSDFSGMIQSERAQTAITVKVLGLQPE